jgi:hypothetical protein
MVWHPCTTRIRVAWPRTTTPSSAALPPNIPQADSRQLHSLDLVAVHASGSARISLVEHVRKDIEVITNEMVIVAIIDVLEKVKLVA